MPQSAQPTAAPVAPPGNFLWIVICGCLISVITFGVRASFGLFNEPLSSAHGWDREVFALAVAVQNLLWGAGQPVAGALADRWGTARVLAGGGVLYTAGVLLMPWADTPALMMLSAGVLVGLGLAGASFSLVVAVLGRQVPAERRSWAMGLATASGSLGQFLYAPMGQGFIGAWGWSTALLLMASSVAVVPLLAVVLRGDGRSQVHDSPEMSVADTLRHAFAQRSYALLVAGFFTCGFQLAFITVHLPPYLGDMGVGAELAGWAIGVIGLFNVVGAYASGVAGGRWSKKYLLAWIYIGRALAISLFVLLPVTPASVLGFAAVIGLLWLSTVPLTSGLVAVMFGTRYMAMLYGIVFFSHQVGSFFGVWLGGVMYDRTGSYELVWWLGVVLSLISAALHLPITERRAPPAVQPAL